MSIHVTKSTSNPAAAPTVLGSHWVNSTNGNHYLAKGTASVADWVLITADTGITQLTGDVTAGPGSGSQAATLANTAVSPGSYTNTSLTVDAKGRLTAASSGTAPVTSVGGTSPIASSGGTTPTISIQTASGAQAGALSSTDWTTFNNKQSGPLTGDVTTSGAAATLATVNSNVGSFGTATQSGTFTVNAKGLITAASNTTIALAASAITSGTIADARLPNPATSAISASDIDWSTLKISSGLYTKTLAANTTFTFSNRTAGQTIVVRLTNTVSNYTVTWPTVKWSGGTTPTMTTGAKSDVYTFIYDGTDVFGSVVQNF